ncbi:MAG: cyclopropane-fatty-acyl-phospholipid synthase family protein [Acidimicrobiales bacterium]
MATVALQLEPVLSGILGSPPALAIEFWDGSRLGPDAAPATVRFRTPDALRRILYAPGELGFARAYVYSDIDVDGDIHHALRVLASSSPELAIGWRGTLDVIRAAVRLKVVGRPLPPPPEEARLQGRLHSVARDAEAISHHYDVSNEFYELFLGPSMTYSCARFTTAEATLEEAQAAKYELVCRKLGLTEGYRVLDVGCGWGGMVIHAAQHHGASAVGVTISREQFDIARKRVAQAGLADRVEIRLQDYREITDGPFDAISSIGMAEHVGRASLRAYFAALTALLRPKGRLLNHAISTPNGAAYDRRSFIARYVFPDGELPDVAEVVSGMQAQGLDVRDVEGLREHYALTLRRWSANLEAGWEQACALVGERRARVWRLYLAGAAVSFEAAEIGIHQVLGVKVADDGTSGMPLTRAAFV